MKYLLTIIFQFFIGNSIFATGQIPDYLIYKSDTVAIFSNPLEQYLAKSEKRELIDFIGCGSTACWRGYKAIWELRNDSLFLRQVTSCHKDCGLETKDADLYKMFGKNNILAYWFTGKIVRPKGKLVQYIHMAYASIYEEEEIFTFYKGKLKSIKLKSNKKIIDKIYAQKHSWELAKLSIDTIFYHIRENINWEQLDKSKYMCDDEYLLTFNKKGKIKKIKFKPWADTKREDWWYNFVERKCRQKIKKSLKSLRLDYLKPKMTFTIEIDLFYKAEEKKLELNKSFEFNEY